MQNFKDDLIEYKCLCFNKNYQHIYDENLKKPFFKKKTLCTRDNNKIILLLQKRVYPYKRMDDWEKFNQTRLLEKKEFYSNLNMEDVTDAAYTHAK